MRITEFYNKEGSTVFPLGQDTLLLIKVFIFITCVCFWIKVIVDALLRIHGIGRHFSNRHRF